MREMKDSGIQWIGMIPKHWQTRKIKYLTVCRNESGLCSENNNYIGLENVSSYSNELLLTNTEYETAVQSVCKKGDILFSKLRPYLAKVLVAKQDSYCTSEFIVFKSFVGYNKYLYYSLLNPCFIENVNASTYGTKMPRANSNYILNQTICSPPPLSEQKRIADFLDGKCGEIDGLVADIQSQIDTLEQYKRSVITETVTKGLDSDVEMKDSGIEWVGMIPKHWDLKKLKHISTCRSESGLFNEENDKYIGLENVVSYSNKLIVTNTRYESSIQNICREGDVLFSKLRPYLAKAIIAKEHSYCTSEFIVFSSFDGEKRYLYYFLLSSGFIENINASTYGTKMPRANPNYVLNQKVCCPPLTEQKRIADFIDAKCTEVDSIIDQKKEQLTVLDNYKKSLIYEYVTGKKEVPAQ